MKPKGVQFPLSLPVQFLMSFDSKHAFVHDQNHRGKVSRLEGGSLEQIRHGEFAREHPVELPDPAT